eukprot:c5171_g1_i1.p1 GENE.c5171_g1_i1~~c5171_g1_i1.p1  ORF type:complete len:180 (-),score=25.21 c5171_g1_i1:30-569(-)
MGSRRLRWCIPCSISTLRSCGKKCFGPPVTLISRFSREAIVLGAHYFWRATMTLTIDAENVSWLCIACLGLARKFLEDLSIPNSLIAREMGLDLKDLNFVERLVAHSLAFSFNVQPEQVTEMTAVVANGLFILPLSHFRGTDLPCSDLLEPGTNMDIDSENSVDDDEWMTFLNPESVEF